MGFVKSKLIKEYLRNIGANEISPRIIPKIDEEIKLLLDNALLRCQSNNRKTIMERDI